ncbi:MAG: ComF family protein, partial [Rhodanobacteraceae bacterium]
MVDSAGARLLRIVLPPRCLLCGATGANGRDLCAGCAGDLAINHPCCPRCALPLETPAPICGECLRHEPPFATCHAPFVYGHPLDLLERRFKFGGDLAAGRVLGEIFADRLRAEQATLPKVLVPVPLHDARLRERGYNQSLELARPLARTFGLPLRHDIVRRIKATPPQTGLDAPTRRRNLRDAFSIVDGSELPDHIAIIDDVMTTGATVRACALALRRTGVARIDV